MKRGEQLSFTGRVREQVQLKNRVSQPTSGWRKREQVQQQLTFAQVVTQKNACRSQSEESATQLKVKVEPTAWLDNCYIGCLLEASNMQLVKESFVLGGFGMVRLRHCFESIGALVGKVVEVDQATLAKEVLEYVRLRVSIPVGVSPSMKREVSINGLSCLVVFEIETCMPDHKLRSFFSKWGDVSILESVPSSEDDGGKESVDSVGSHSDDENGSGGGEELTVQCAVAQAAPSLGVVQQKMNVMVGLWEETKNDRLEDVQGAVCHETRDVASLDLSKVVGGVNMVKRLNVDHSTRILGSGEKHVACHYGNHDGVVKLDKEVEHIHRDPRIGVSHAMCIYGNHGGELNAHEGQGTFNGKVERRFEDWHVGFPSGNEERNYGGSGPIIAEVEQSRGAVKGDVGVARPVHGDGQDRLGVKDFVTFSSMVHESGTGGVSREKEVLEMEVDEGVRHGSVGHEGDYLCRQHNGVGQAMADRVGAAGKVGMGRAEYSRWNGDPESIVGDSQITRMEKVKDLACFLEAWVNGTPSLADREVDDYKLKGLDETSSPFEESNLIEVRVVQANYPVLQPTLSSTPIFFAKFNSYFFAR
ncbi:hypothetical protein VNO80_22923 [Phaseolus coccineus]|uniref:Uncharacterized protein n=1 Tax=Phaseolus coccineus TaxID=3886 RepID=A0AAN9M4Z7_PHACN